MTEVRDAPVAHRLRQINTAFWKYSTNPPRLAPLERREDWVFEPLYSASTIEALTAERDALLSRVERLEKALTDCLKELDRSERPSYAWQLRARAALQENIDGN